MTRAIDPTSSNPAPEGVSGAATPQARKNGPGGFAATLLRALGARPAASTSPANVNDGTEAPAAEGALPHAQQGAARATSGKAQQADPKGRARRSECPADTETHEKQVEKTPDATGQASEAPDAAGAALALEVDTGTDPAPHGSQGGKRSRTGHDAGEGDSGKDPAPPAHHEASKPSRTAIEAEEPQAVPPISPAAPRASPPTKELRAPDRGGRGAPVEGAASTPETPRQESPAPPPALIHAPPAARAAAPATQSDASFAERAAAVPRAADLPAQGAVLKHAANLRIETPELGEVSLHLRIRSGVATVRFEGENAAALRDRAPELAHALASEGISLARVEPPTPPASAQSGGQAGNGQASWEGGAHGGGRDRNAEDPGTPATHPARPERRSVALTPGRVHVQA